MGPFYAFEVEQEGRRNGGEKASFHHALLGNGLEKNGNVCLRMEVWTR